MLALLSPLVFLLPYNSGERIGFSVTILLALSVFMTMVADQVPQKSLSLPRVVYMTFISYCLTTLVVIIVVINARIHDISDCIPVPCCLTAFVTLTKFFCCCLGRRREPMTSNAVQKENKDADACVEDAGAELGSRKTKRDKTVTWQDVSWAIDIIAMTVIYALKIALLASTFGER